MNKFSAAVIGLGNIGMQYDESTVGSDHILTHCKSFESHAGYELVGAVDICSQKRNNFEQKYKKPSFKSISDLLNYTRPDVVAFCVPPQLQRQMVSEFLNQHLPKGVILEKPLAPTTEEAHELANLLNDNKIVTCVNYIRRFEPGVLSMLDSILSGKIGTLKKVIAWYSKSLKTNGCHIIDLMNYIFSAIDKSCVPTIVNCSEPNEHLLLQYNTVQAHLFLNPSDSIRFEIELIGDKGIISYLRNGRQILLKTPKQHDVFRQIQVLEEIEEIPNDLYRYQWYVQDALYNTLSRSNIEMNSNINTALITEALIDKAINFKVEV